MLKVRTTRRERIASGVIKPGHLLKLESTDKVAVHAAAGGYCQKMFAIEDELQGKTVSDAYADGDRVQYEIAQRGDEVQALLKANENVAIGDPLESAGDGTLQKYVANTADINVNVIVAFALAASNVSSVAQLAVEVA
jgi:hypothetical protein